MTDAEDDLEIAIAERDAAIAEANRLREHIRLHAGDTLSLQNEIDNLTAHAEDEVVAAIREERDAARLDRDKLRTAMVYAVNQTDAVISDSCSVDFLCQGGEEIAVFARRLRVERDAALAKLAEAESAERDTGWYLASIARAYTALGVDRSDPDAADPAYIGEHVERLVKERDRLAAELARARGLLRLVVADADVYTQPEGDKTRGWCSDMNRYLRGGVGIVNVISVEDKARIDAFLAPPADRGGEAV